MVDALSHRSESDVIPFYGMTVHPAIVAGMAVGEMLVHGRDLALTHGTDQDTTLPDAGSYTALLAAFALTDFTLTEPGRRAVASFGYRLAARRPLTVRLDRGTTTIGHDENPPIDAWFSGSPGTLLLATHGRLSPWQSLRTIRLGRRPWRALTIDRLFEPS